MLLLLLLLLGDHRTNDRSRAAVHRSTVIAVVKTDNATELGAG
jgi:hypothetical protein